MTGVGACVNWCKMDPMDVEQAKRNQLKNIESRTGKAISELGDAIRESGLAKHGEIVAMLKERFGIGHGDANAVAHHVKEAASGAKDGGGDVLDEIYTGAKAHLRPIHDRLMEAVAKLGEHEVAPKKGYVSLRRKKQFAMIGPATNSQIEVGLNMKGVAGTDRLKEQPAGGMCQYKLRLSSVDEVDADLMSWVGQAYDSAG